MSMMKSNDAGAPSQRARGGDDPILAGAIDRCLCCDQRPSVIGGDDVHTARLVEKLEPARCELVWMTVSAAAKEATHLGRTRR